MRRALWIAALIITAQIQPARADDTEETDRKVTYRQKTEIDFEGLEVEGEIVKPSSALVLERKKADFNPLVKIRENWNDEIETSIDEAK